MSTHGCFAFFFPHTLLVQPDDGAPETTAHSDDYHFYPEGGYYYELADELE